MLLILSDGTDLPLTEPGVQSFTYTVNDDGTITGFNGDLTIGNRAFGAFSTDLKSAC